MSNRLKILPLLILTSSTGCSEKNINLQQELEKRLAGNASGTANPSPATATPDTPSAPGSIPEQNNPTAPPAQSPNPGSPLVVSVSGPSSVAAGEAASIDFEVQRAPSDPQRALQADFNGTLRLKIPATLYGESLVRIEGGRGKTILRSTLVQTSQIEFVSLTPSSSSTATIELPPPHTLSVRAGAEAKIRFNTPAMVRPGECSKALSVTFVDPFNNPTALTQTRNFKLKVSGIDLEFFEDATCEKELALQPFWPAAKGTAELRFFVKAPRSGVGEIQVSDRTPAEASPAPLASVENTLALIPTIGQLHEGRYQHGANRLLDGRILVSGGMRSPFESTPSSELYHPQTGEWERSGKLWDARSQHTSTLLKDGRVIVTGGRKLFQSGSTISYLDLSTTEIYDPATGTWRPGPNMPEPRVGHRATLLPDGRLLILGGTFTLQRALMEPSHALLLDVETGIWTQFAPPAPSTHLADLGVLQDGRPYALLRGINGIAGSLLTFDPQAAVEGAGAKIWTQVMKLPEALDRVTFNPIGKGRYLILGTPLREGYQAHGAWIWNALAGPPASRPSPTPEPSFVRAKVPQGGLRSPRQMVRLSTGELLMARESSTGAPYGSAIGRVEIYQPGTGQWREAQDSRLTTRLHSLTALDDGEALLAGGDWNGPEASKWTRVLK